MNGTFSKILKVTTVATSLLLTALYAAQGKNLCKNANWAGCGKEADSPPYANVYRGVLWSNADCTSIDGSDVKNPDQFQDILNNPECEFGKTYILCVSVSLPWFPALPECGVLNNQGIRWTLNSSCPEGSTKLEGELYDKWKYAYTKSECQVK